MAKAGTNISPALVLHLRLEALGIPVEGVSFDGLAWHVSYRPEATPTQQATGDAIAADFDGLPRTFRPLYEIYGDLAALTATQKGNVWADLSSGTPKRYLADLGENAASIGALDWAATDSGASGAALTAARLRITTAYVQDNPFYLIEPPFDPSINVSGVS